MSDIITLEEFSELKPIECPNRGFVDYPCVVCKECDIGKVEMTFGEGVLIEKTVNSILLHLMLDITDNDLFSRYYLGQVKNGLSKILPFIQRGDWDEGDLTILLTQDMDVEGSMIDYINTFYSEFPIRWRQIVIEASRVIKDMGESRAKKLAHEYFRDLTTARIM